MLSATTMVLVKNYETLDNGVSVNTDTLVMESLHVLVRVCVQDII